MSEISLRGISPAWCTGDQVQEWFSGIVHPQMDYTLTHTSYKDSLWIISVYVYDVAPHCRIMFLAHNTTATRDQEIEARLVIFGQRATALIEYTRSLALRRIMSEDHNEASEKGVIQKRTGAILASCLRLVTSSKRGDSTGKSRVYQKLPQVHFVVKTDISIGLIQARYRSKLSKRQSLRKANVRDEKKVEVRTRHLERVPASSPKAAGTMDQGQAATIVQAMLRGRVARSAINADLKVHRRRREIAAMTLQSSMRRRSVQLHMKMQKQAATKMQARFRGHRVRKRALVRVGEGMMSEVAGRRHHANGERARLRDSGLRGQDVDAVLRLSKFVGTH